MASGCRRISPSSSKVTPRWRGMRGARDPQRCGFIPLRSAWNRTSWDFMGYSCDFRWFHGIFMGLHGIFMGHSCDFMGFHGILMFLAHGFRGDILPMGYRVVPYRDDILWLLCSMIVQLKNNNCWWHPIYAMFILYIYTQYMWIYIYIDVYSMIVH